MSSGSVRMTRSQQWEGACNVRDLGGLRRSDGTSTASGRLFRSGRTEAVTEVGWRAAQAAGVQTVVDLRNADEIARGGTGRATASPRPNIVTLHRPIEDQTNPDFMNQYGQLLAHPAYYPGNLQYFPDLLASAIEAIATSPPGLLFHCSAGRDRTGLIAAILLTINEVVLDEVLDDYEAGIRGYNNWQHQHPGQGREKTLPDAELTNAVEDRVEFLGVWLSETDIPNVLVEDLSVGEQTVETASQLPRP